MKKGASRAELVTGRGTQREAASSSANGSEGNQEQAQQAQSESHALTLVPEVSEHDAARLCLLLVEPQRRVALRLDLTLGPRVKLGAGLCAFVCICVCVRV